MIFRRVLSSELTSTAGAVFTVLLSILFSVGLVRILGDAAGGTVDDREVLAIVALTALTWLPHLLALPLFIAVVLTLSRAYRDSEMIVWFVSGRSLAAWLPPVLKLALPTALLVAAIAGWVAPWADRQIQQSRERFAQREDVNKVAAGRFIESRAANRVFFVETSDLERGEVRNVFVADRGRGRDSVIVAARGTIETTPEGDRFLVLQDGRRYTGAPGTPEYRLEEFARYALRLESTPPALLRGSSTRGVPTGELLRNRTPAHKAELLWRVSLPLVVLLLALLAVPLTYRNPRAGRSFNLIVAVLVYLVYFNGIQIAQGMVRSGRLAYGTAIWLPHATVLALTLLLFVRRVYLQRWVPRWLTPGYWRDRAARA
ncbi:MAG: LPS export ABC transporter permease LptF [Betaproteobacteria bacterium]